MPDNRLNELVAAHIFNNPTPIYEGGMPYAGDYRFEEANPGWYLDRSDFPNPAPILPRPFDSNMSLAWKVVEKMTEPPVEEWHQNNTKFMLWFESADLWAMSEQEAAKAICVVSLAILGVIQVKGFDDERLTTTERDPD